MRSLFFVFFFSFASCTHAFALVSTYGLGVNDDMSAAQRAASRQVRDRCMA